MWETEFGSAMAGGFAIGGGISMLGTWEARPNAYG
jgi:hypothetical protein